MIMDLESVYSESDDELGKAATNTHQRGSESNDAEAGSSGIWVMP